MPEELREKINDILAKNYARRGKTYSTATLASQRQSQERMNDKQTLPHEYGRAADVGEPYEQDRIHQQ